MEKRAQQTTSMPFGMIFSLFLIIAFIVFAFIAVKFFFGIQNKANIGLFYEDLQDAVDDVSNSQYTDGRKFKINNLPKEIEKICFANLSKEITNNREEYKQIKDYEGKKANLFLVPPEYAEDQSWRLIKEIDLDKIIEDENPYCVNAKGELTISKDFYGNVVIR